VTLTLRFEAGTLTLEGERKALFGLPPLPKMAHDERTAVLRGPGGAYREVFATLYRMQQRGEVVFEDKARAWAELPLAQSVFREPFPYQREAIEAWEQSNRRGVVVLPTGAGKSYVAELALARSKRPAMVIAPTIDLMNQWYDILSSAFSMPIGILGGGYHEIEPLTVSTYDSAYLHMERFGDRFGLLIFDECHHLPGPSVSMIAEMSMAPWRLGLTATPERSDGSHTRLEELVGPFVYRKGIKDMAGSYLAEYDVVTLKTPLSAEDAQRYQEARETYRQFVRSKGLYMGGPGAWGEFVRLTNMSKDGRRAFKAYQLQRRIALAHAGKIHALEGLLKQHGKDRVIVFTNDNDTVYTISQRFLLPAITHQTPTKERKAWLDGFNKGDFPCIVTSKVLNEGVNVPEANVAIIMAGSGTVREHVQRLGRILRRREGKRALLYEMITEETVEEFVSQRRREHDAYR
jgi:superfamily II DNA or RNA helicase